MLRSSLRLGILLLWATATGVWALPLSTPTSPPGPETSTSNSAEGLWRGSDGTLLPFGSFEEIEEFLSTARVVAAKSIATGITRPYKLTLERDGIRMHAIFRYVNVFKPRWDSPEGLKLNFRDSCYFEVAAYRLSRLFGFGHVPPTVSRNLDRVDFSEPSIRSLMPSHRGTLQAWVEGARTEKDRREAESLPLEGRLWLYQHQMMALFDALIYNEDRNQGNILIGADWTIWFIDSTRAFRPLREPRDLSTLRLCKRRVWELLQSVTDGEVRSALDGVLSGMEIDTLLMRRARVVERIESLIRSRGEASVLFDIELPLADPPSRGVQPVGHPSGDR